MSEAETNIEGCVFCKIGQNEIPDTELLYHDVDYAVFRFVNLILDIYRSCFKMAIVGFRERSVNHIVKHFISGITNL